MSLFGKPPTPEDERRKRSQNQIAHGGLPLDAERRLSALTRQGKPGFFTSSLSVNEFVLAASEGVQPLGQVMGSSVYHVGRQYTPIYSSGELIALTHAHTEARRLSLGRLQQEAQLLGAHGVVGVRLERKSYEWGDNLLEFTALGTAVAIDTQPKPAVPFISALSGQEWYVLHQAGYQPVGFAYGTCIYYLVASYATRWATQNTFLGGYGNMELTDYTQAVYHARHAAQTRLTQEAARTGADGVVGMTIEPWIRTYEVEINNQTRRDLLVHFTAFGTAIAERGSTLPSIDYTLPLTD